AVERGFRFRPILRVTLADDSGDTLVLRFFHFRQAQARAFEVGQRLLCSGEARRSLLGLEMIHPGYRRVPDDADVVVVERLRPVYPTTEGLDERRLAGWVAAALRHLPGDGELELLPRRVLHGLKLPRLADALRYVHAPPPDVRLEDMEAGRHPSQRR